MSFGTKSAPEVFQRIMDEMLEGISGAYATMDDILVTGRDDDHNDGIHKQVINRATTYNLELNTEKTPLLEIQCTLPGTSPDITRTDCSSRKGESYTSDANTTG